MNLWRVEITSWSRSISSECSSIWSWNSTIIVSQIINIILLSIKFKLSYSLLGIGASSCRSSWRNTSSISDVSSVVHIVLFITLWTPIKMWVRFSCNVKCSSRFLNTKNLISFNNISEFLNIWFVLAQRIGRGNIWMMFFSQVSVSFFDLFWS